MKVKISTKEKFHVLDIQEQFLSANMTEELDNLLLPFLKKDIRNIVIKMGNVDAVEESVALALLNIQQQFYNKNSSFVLCEIRSEILKYFEQLNLPEQLNITPTESEAWDIIQMEEIERELLND